ncbi:MAG: hypothetical protein ACREQQ_10805 [Candidatus Binatia bacterium]
MVPGPFLISDTALGFLLGFASTAFYSITRIPIARLADRTLRHATRDRYL